jgi:hypothetical protein
MTRARHELEQRRGRTLPGLLAFLTNQSAREIVHTCRRYVAERGEINVALGLATGAFEFKPWERDSNCRYNLPLPEVGQGPRYLLPPLLKASSRARAQLNRSFG